MNIINSKIWIFVLLASSGILLHAQYNWPAGEDEIELIYNVYTNESVATVIIANALIQSISAGTIQFERSKSSTLPGLVGSQALDNLSIFYEYIDPYVTIGQKINSETVIGKVQEDKRVLIRIYDELSGKFINPLSILPLINRKVKITLEDFLFFYPDSEDAMQISRRINSGVVDLRLAFQIREDKKGEGIIPPKLIRLQIANNEIEIMGEDLNTTESSLRTSEKRLVEWNLSNINIPRGYFDIKIYVLTFLGGERTFSFNVFAK